MRLLLTDAVEGTATDVPDDIGISGIGKNLFDQRDTGFIIIREVLRSLVNTPTRTTNMLSL